MAQKENKNCYGLIAEGKGVLDSLIHKIEATNIRSLDKEIVSRCSAKLKKVLDADAAQIDFSFSELEGLTGDEKTNLLKEKGFLGHIFYAELVIEAFIDVYNGKGKSRGYLGNRLEIYGGNPKEFSLLKTASDSIGKIVDLIFLGYNLRYTPNERKEEYNLMIGNILHRSIRTKLGASEVISKENNAPERYKRT